MLHIDRTHDVHAVVDVISGSLYIGLILNYAHTIYKFNDTLKGKSKQTTRLEHTTLASPDEYIWKAESAFTVKDACLHEYKGLRHE